MSTVISLIYFLVHEWSRSAPSGGSHVVYILVYITKSVFSLTSNHIFVHFNDYDTFYSDNKVMCTKVCRVYGWKTDIESTNRGQVYLYHELIGDAAF